MKYLIYEFKKGYKAKRHIRYCDTLAEAKIAKGHYEVLGGMTDLHIEKVVE